ncbi:flagellar hook-associated protein FlgL [Acidithiobacillus sulfuriphilus]|uniref:flagellar hook-associated protein FlgL n=1 Tax=Acidithiobacillus sulfuriphilus TaxID=1867749 RepID=UPI003F6047A5
MRVSTQQFYSTSLTGMLNQQSTLNNLSQQLSTGNALGNPADNPVANAQVLNLSAKLSNLGAYQQANQSSQQDLQLSSSVLQSVNSLISQVQQLAVQMNNATVSAQDRQNAATAMTGNLQQLVQLANTQNANGQYVFAGSQSGTQPFQLQANGNVQYMGDGAQKSLMIGPGLNMPVSEAGSAVFMDVPAGNGSFTVSAAAANSGSSGTATMGPGSVLDPGAASQQLVVQQSQYQITFAASGTAYSITSGTGTVGSAGWNASSGTVVSGASYTPGQSIGIPATSGGVNFLSVPVAGTPVAGDSFTIAASQPQSIFQTFSDLQQALSSMGSGPGANTQRAQAISNVLANLNQAQTQVLSTQSSIGARLQQAQSVSSLNSSLTLQFQTQQGNLADISYPQVITQYQQSLTALQASQKAFAQVQGLSLFQYIS